MKTECLSEKIQTLTESTRMVGGVAVFLVCARVPLAVDARGVSMPDVVAEVG